MGLLSGLAERILTDIEHRTVYHLQDACTSMLTDWYDRIGRNKDTIRCLKNAMVATDITSVAG